MDRVFRFPFHQPHPHQYYHMERMENNMICKIWELRNKPIETLIMEGSGIKNKNHFNLSSKIASVFPIKYPDPSAYPLTKTTQQPTYPEGESNHCFLNKSASHPKNSPRRLLSPSNYPLNLTTYGVDMIQ